MVWQNGGSLAVHFGTYYPTGYIVAVFDPPEAERAVAALRDSTCAPHEVRTFSGREVLDLDAAFRHQRTVGQRVGALIASAVADEGEAQAVYLEAARRGRSLVVVHAPTHEQMEGVARILTAHGAQRMHHYGQLVMTDLSSGPPNPAPAKAPGATSA
jgi:hypothetical protein